MPPSSKRCRRCRELKPADHFYQSAANRDGLQGWCKDCMRTAERVWRQKHPGRFVSRRRLWTLRDYGITADAVKVLKAEQAGECRICHLSSDSLEIDHDHATGAVRGLLCGFCNKGLGLFRDDPQRLRAAATYLEEQEDHRTHRALW